MSGEMYDANGRICAVAEATVDGVTQMTGYVYDAEGRRVAKGTITTWSCDPSTNGFTTSDSETDYVLNQSGQQVTEMAMDSNGAMNWEHTNVWADGQLIATYSAITDASGQPNGALHFYLDDWLGTRRVQTDYAGVVEQTCTSLPYGDAESCAPTPTEQHFTGKDHDTESGLDYFYARYYSETLGRFMTPDWAAAPAAVPYAAYGDPQSLNLYAYVQDNPLIGIDATGHYSSSDPTAETEEGESDAAAGQSEMQNQANSQDSSGDSNSTGTPGTNKTPGSDPPPKPAGDKAQQQSQLSASDVSKAIKTYDSDKGGKGPARVVKALNSMGTDFKLGGDALRAGVKESGVGLPKAAGKVLDNVSSITRTGDNVVITNERAITVDGVAHLGQTISFTVTSVNGQPALQNIKGISVGLGFLKKEITHYGP